MSERLLRAARRQTSEDLAIDADQFAKANVIVVGPARPYRRSWWYPGDCASCRFFVSSRSCRPCLSADVIVSVPGRPLRGGPEHTNERRRRSLRRSRYRRGGGGVYVVDTTNARVLKFR